MNSLNAKTEAVKPGFLPKPRIFSGEEMFDLQQEIRSLARGDAGTFTFDEDDLFIEELIVIAICDAQIKHFGEVFHPPAVQLRRFTTDYLKTFALYLEAR